MNKTPIGWVKNPDGSQGYTWNPITGCLNGCSYCYARKLANGRLRQRYLANLNVIPYIGEEQYMRKRSDPFYPRFWLKRLWELYRSRMKPRGIFVCDMGELFGDWLPRQWQDAVFETIRMNDRHRFYLLTKQPQNLIKFSPFPDNCWAGVTATDRYGYSRGIPGLRRIEAKLKFISFEPLLERIEVWDSKDYWLEAEIGWVIIGAQTKPYKPPKWEWVSEIIEACAKANIPYFLKNNLEPIMPKVFGGDGPLIQELPCVK